MEGILLVIGLVLTFQYLDYQVKTGDKSIQGFIEYLKRKYYNKNKD